MRLVGLFSASLALTACAAIHPGQHAASRERNTVVTIERTSDGWEDPTQSLAIVVRDVNDPTHALSDALIIVGPRGTVLESPDVPRVTSRADGTGKMMIAAPGVYSVLARRIGYQRFEFSVDVRPRCPSVLEVYMAQAPNCLVECPVTPARAVLTTCRRAA